MRFLFVTDLAQDLRLFRHGGDVFWYGLLAAAAIAAPFLLDVFYVREMSTLFILAIAGIGLMLLTGYAGLVSLGHAAFVGIGAYAHAYLLARGIPFAASLPMAGLAAGAVGVLVGLPLLRLKGIYLIMATYGFAMIIEEIITAWTPVTGGLNGLRVAPPTIAGFDLSGARPFYFVALAVLVAILLVAANIVRGPTGRALVAIRDSETAAQSLGVSLWRYRTLAFALSAAAAGIAGALFGHYLGHISPEAFGFSLSIQLVLMVIIGGLGSLHGAVLGAAVITLLPQAIAFLRDALPPAIGRTPGLESGVFGLILILAVVFEPRGLWGRWLKLKLYFQLFPIYRHATFRRQRSYMQSERLR